jgi:hypothetical protein
MSGDKISAGVIIVAIFVAAGLMSQCSYNVAECKQEAIKAGRHTAEQIKAMCSQ